MMGYGTSAKFDGNCGSVGAGFASPSLGTFNLTSNINGLITSDADNTQVSGSKISASSITDFNTFDPNFLRSWVPEPLAAGRCSTATDCRAYDFTPRQPSNVNDFLENGAFPANSTDPCPNLTYQNGAVVEAVEVVGDHIGNDDGLCHNNEMCLFSPHMGARGKAPPDELRTCDMSTQTGYTGVTMLGYSP